MHLHTYQYKHTYTETHNAHTHKHTWICWHKMHTHTHSQREPIYTLGRSIFRNPPSREHMSVDHHGLPLRLPSRRKSSMVDIATVAAPVECGLSRQKTPSLDNCQSSSSFARRANRPSSTCWGQIPPSEEIKYGKGSCHHLWSLQCHRSKINVGKFLRAVKCVHDCFIWVIMEGIRFVKQKNTFDYIIKNHPDFCFCLYFQEFNFENTGKDNK